MTSFGAYCRSRRLAAGLSLREFCLRFGFDAVVMSGIERDKRPAPAGHALRALSLALHQADNADAPEATFLSLATASRRDFEEGVLPREVTGEYLPALVYGGSGGFDPEALTSAARANDDYRDGRELITTDTSEIGKGLQ